MIWLLVDVVIVVPGVVLQNCPKVCELFFMYETFDVMEF